MYFNKNLKIPNGEYHIPGLVWQVKGESLSLFAYKTKRLTAGAQLHSAPFFNVDSKNGNVCLGNAELKQPEWLVSHVEPKLTYQMFTKHWEDMFFLSEFSHVLNGNPTKTNLVLATLKSKQAFDNAELLPVKKLKLKNLMK
jgi:PRTRC genetic system protein B